MINKLIKHRIIRYIIAGGMSACVNLFVLYFAYYIFGIYYILASIIAFAVAFFVSLILHKYWTFESLEKDNLYLQMGKYLLSSLFGLCINTIILYICVDYFFFPVIVGQLCAGGFTACITFFISRNYVFNSK